MRSCPSLTTPSRVIRPAESGILGKDVSTMNLPQALSPRLWERRHPHGARVPSPRRNRAADDCTPYEVVASSAGPGIVHPHGQPEIRR
jgi:hypothetical protein